MNTTLLGVVPFVYLAAFLLYLTGIVTGRPPLSRKARITAACGFALHTAGLVLRWIESCHMGFGHAPLSNFYESLIFFSWAIVIACLFVEFRKQTEILGLFAFPAAFLLMAYASYSPDVESRIRPLIPALRSNWLVAHVATCFLGYGAFAIAAVFGFLYLRKKEDPPGKAATPGKEQLQESLYRSVAVGYVLFTLGIITGSVWAHSAWGSWWSWDPKETWALVTWMIYTALLHRRIAGKDGAKGTAVLSLVGLASVLFTYFGVNYLPGLHAYL
jgi:cytochrome c-type biogenesis protein CcsB